MPTLVQLAEDLAAGAATSEELVEDCLARIKDPAGEGEATFTAVDAGAARETARAIDALRRVGAEPSPYAGIPVSVKDLFDVRGQSTRAGSRVLDDAPAGRDATAVARWRRAGLVLIGRTNMTEFAFSGLGLNPHYGTPANPWDRDNRRIPGGSSSGAAISVVDGMAHGAIGTDTGGSCRIPAALCGLVGFKPTQARVPRDGMIPLSPTLDAVGVIGRSVECCAILDAILRDDEPGLPAPLRRGPRLAVSQNYLSQDIEPAVAASFDRAIQVLRDSGADVAEIDVPEFDQIPEITGNGGFAAAESFAWHQHFIEEKAAAYDPRVLVRIERGVHLTARDLLALQDERGALVEAVSKRLDGFDALICPTVPMVAPRIADLADDDEYARINILMLRNPTVVNLLDGCAASIPMHVKGEPPMGLMISGLAENDAKILRIAAWAEELLCHSSH